MTEPLPPLLACRREVVEDAQFLRWDGTELTLERLAATVGEDRVAVTDHYTAAWSGRHNGWIELIDGWWVQIGPDLEGIAEMWTPSAFAMTWTPTDEAALPPGQGTALLAAYDTLRRVEDTLATAIRLARHSLHREAIGTDAPGRFAALEHAARAGLLGGTRKPDQVGTPSNLCTKLRICRRVLDAPVEDEVLRLLVGTHLDVGDVAGIVRSAHPDPMDPLVLLITLETE